MAYRHIIIFSIYLPISAINFAVAQNAEDLDWVKAGNICRGNYEEPSRAGIFDTTPINEAITNVDAQNLTYDLTNDVTTLNGQITMQTSSLEVQAEQGILDRANANATFRGNVRLRDKGTLFIGDNLTLNTTTGEARLNEAQYVLHEGKIHGSAKYIERNSNKNITLKSATYSRCRPDSNAWQINSNLLRLNPTTGFGSATNAVLRIKNVPIFYLPYFSFPIDSRRSSGFLAPSIGSSKNNGFTMQTPYYLNLAPNFDATIYPSYLTNNGLLLENELRYLTNNNEGQIALSFINDDNNKRKYQSLYKQQRWLYNLKHNYYNNKLNAGFNITDISDPYYLQDLPNEFINYDNNKDYITQNIYLNYKASDLFNTKLNFYNYKMASISEITPYNKLPHLNIYGSYNSLININYNFDVINFKRNLKTGNFTDIDNNKYLWLDEHITGFKRVNGQRLHNEFILTKNINYNYVYIKPSLTLINTAYNLTLDDKGKNYMLANGEQFKSNHQRNINIVQLDSSLILNKTINNKIKTITPRILFTYIPYKNQDNLPVFDSDYKTFNYNSLWQYNRFDSIDRIGDTKQIAYGITYQNFNANNDEIQRLSIGRARYFNTQKVQLPGINYLDLNNISFNNSPYAVIYKQQLSNKLSLYSNINYQQETHKITSSNLNFNYIDVDNRILNIGHSYNNNNNLNYNSYTGRWNLHNDYIDPITGEVIKNYYKTNQIDLSGALPITPSLTFLANVEYDYNRKRYLEYFTGINYKSCCWQVSLINRYWLDDNSYTLSKELNKKYNHGVFLQITLNGLGNLSGNNKTNLLKNKIKGYKEYEY